MNHDVIRIDTLMSSALGVKPERKWRIETLLRKYD